MLKIWMRERAGRPTDPLFPTRTGGQLTRDAIERRLAKHLQTARHQCPTLRSKQVSMHTLRHTAAVMLLSAGVDTSTIALWLGHEQERTTHIYLHADLAIKQRALDRATPPNGRPGRYRPPDPLLAFSKISDAIMPTFVATNRAFCGEFQAKVGMPAGSALLFPCRRRHGYRLLHVAARLAFHGRRGRLRLQHDWPWASQLAAAFGKLKALPAATG